MRRSPLSALGVSYRLAALVIISVVSLVAVGLGGWMGISQVANSVTTLQDERLPAANLLGEIRSSTSTLLQYSFEVLSREKQVNAQSRFKQVLERKRLIANNLTQAMTAYESLPKSAEEAEAWKKFKDSMVPWRARNDELSAILQTLSENDDFDKQPQLFGQYKQPLASWGFVQSSVDVNLTKLLSLNRAAAEQARAHDMAVQKLALRFITATLGVAVVLLLVLAIVIVRSITVPLGRLRHTIVSIANDNDFTRRADVHGRDEMGQTAEAFNRLLEGAHASLRDVLGNAESISVAAQRVAQASQQAAESSGDQSEASATMAAAIEQMTVSINHINDSMHEASGQAQEAGAAAKTGSEIILRSNAEIDTIAQAVQSTSEAIDHLSKESERISLILQVIKEVADQTNLLALNAAIEAARAGEQGRGFAVVADEVRKLAERTTHSTTEIASLIQSMQSSGHEAVRCMGLVDKQVGSGKALSSDAVDHIKGIYDHAMQVVSVISDVSAAIHEQSTTAQSIAREVESVARLTESGHVTASETAKVSQDLDMLAENLRVAVNRFKV